MPPIGRNGTNDLPSGLRSTPAKSSCIAARGFQRVGFSRGFGVMVSVLWAFEDLLGVLIPCSKYFKYLSKMAETGEANKSDVDHIDRSGAALGFRIGLQPAQLAPEIWMLAALILCNPSHVGFLFRHAKLECRL